jgi:PAS domain S-box-containing protein
LLVDDDESTRQTLALILRNKGYETETAATGQEALKKARERAFNLACLDIRLPDVEGGDLIAPLKEIHPPTVVIMITGHASVGSAVQALNEGASGYITKPLNMDELLALVREALEKQQLVEEKRRAESQRDATLEALRQSEERLRQFFESMPEYGYLVSPEGTVLDVNKAACRALGYKKEELVGKPLKAIYAPESLPRMKELLARWQETGQLLDEEMVILTRNGERRTVLLSADVIREGEGQVLHSISVQKDITERKEAETALKKAAAEWQATFDATTDGIYVLDDDQRILRANKAWARMFNVSADKAVGRYCWEIMHGTDEPIPDCPLVRMKQSRQRETLEYEVAECYFESVVDPILDDGGAVIGALHIVRDTTERRRAEEALQQRASQLALLNEIGGRVAALLDLDQVLGQAAQLVQKRFGFHHVGLFIRASGEDRMVLSACAGEFAPLFPRDHSVALGRGMVGWVGLHGETLLANDVDAEPRYLNPYPDRLPTRSELSVPIRIGDEVVGVLDLQSPQPDAFEPSGVTTLETLAAQVAVAINNARLYSQAAQRNRELTLLNRVIAATAVGEALESVLEVVCRELALAFEVPQAAAALFNEEKTEAVVVAEYLAPGRPPSLGATIPTAGNPGALHLLRNKTPLVIEDAQTDPRQAPIHDLLRQRGTVSLLLLPLMMGEEVVGSLGVDAIEPRAFSAEEVDLAQRVAEQISGVLARARLRKERRQLEEQFHQAQKMEAVGRLAGGVAHDFNNLLTVFHLSTRLMERRLHHEDPLWGHVQRIQDAGQRAAGLVRQLLAFSRREIVEPKVLDLNQVLGELDKMLRRLIGEDLELTLLLADDLAPVKIDPTQVEQVVVNLAVNARDAMPFGGKLTIETANVVLDAAYAAQHLEVEPGEYVLLAVSDDGVGMSEEVQARLFEPFFTTKEKGKGTGLGLATVFGIVKQNQGYIGVYSEPGQGTTFKIYLPRVAEDAPPPPRPPQATARGTETLLLVEDEAQVRELTHDILQGQGYQVLAARDGVEALRVAEAHEGPIHLLLTDVVMPRMSGKGLADQLLRTRPEMRVLFTSGYTDNAIVHHGVLAEGIAFLSKPFELEAIARKVRDVLDA